jgi:dihydrofolate synthase/folylpolyglutamate synthase
VTSALEYLFGLEQFGIKFGLENIRALLARLDHPERAFTSIHIAGTNGKGSVAAMVDAGVRAAGHRGGRYTSPHLIRLNERFTIDGVAVDDATMIAAVEDVRDAVESLRSDGTLSVQPTFFEVTTAVAFELFRRMRVAIATVEVGLGGRLDATNVLTPVATAITSIAFDHQLYLGATLAAIAREKAGIIKPGVPVVTGPMDAEAMSVIEQVARENGSAVVHADAGAVAGRRVGLAGEHQHVNAAIAAELLDILDRSGIVVPPAAVDAALEGVRWPGRIDLRQLPDGREVLFDAAHNPAGAIALADYLRESSQRLPLVFAAMRDKDVRAMLEALLPSVRSVVLTRARTPRSADPEELARVVRAIAPATPFTIEPALDAALSRAFEDNRRILVAGSIFLLGDAMQRLGLHC